MELKCKTNAKQTQKECSVQNSKTRTGVEDFIPNPYLFLTPASEHERVLRPCFVK
jgi:hypothetical protein